MAVRFSNSGNLMLGPVTATIVRSVFSANTATSIGGGGIVNVTGTLSLIGSFVSGNSAPAGAGRGNQPQAVTNIVRSTFRANSVTGSGSGIEVVGGTVGLTRTLVERNRAGGTGGGIDRPDGTVTLTNSIARRNTPDNGNPPNVIPGCVD